ncbi:hypothetical protein [Arthrobacter sp. A2-55]|uniref:hypothetical protein n=1 Tax=Arthrobacter sp. A2-55 TaxID=2897337 RepID=UPI0021CDC1F3|nr:hypothetical protein [Arthrobacter sp. A2-55]MCU6479099.1 hypothetical protein [Arthrobacter sp. A2-55]
MNAWIETPNGSLIQAAAATHLSLKLNNSTNLWDVLVTAAGIPAVFATGLADKESATVVRNRLAIAVTQPADQPSTYTFNHETGTIDTSRLAV